KSVAFFRSWRISSSSASRIIWSTLDWNSRDRERALRTQKPATLSARGRSLGPITTSATTPTSNSSGQPISNSIEGSPEERRHHWAPQKRASYLRNPGQRQSRAVCKRLGAMPPIGVGLLCFPFYLQGIYRPSLHLSSR